MKGLLTLLVLAAISAGVIALASLRVGTDDKPMLHVAKEVPLTVVTAKPARESITRLVQAPGDVEAVVDVDISSEIVAKIEELPVEEGDIVKRGDLLCRLNDDNLRAEVESAEARIGQLQATIESADADLEKAERDVEWQRSLSESDANSLREMREHMTVLKKARAARQMRAQELVQAEAMLRRMKEDLQRTVITAPIDGVVANLRAEQGEVVITGTMNNPGTVIMSISDLSAMQVLARVDEVDVPLVKKDQNARIYLQSDPDRPVPARVIRVASKGTKPLGRDVVTFETLLEVLSTDERIKPGMTANVEIEVAQRDDTITVPVEAIANRMRKDLPESIVKELDARQENADLSERVRRAQYVNVVFVKADDVARVRLIDIGIADTRRVEVVSGIVLDDVVITGPYRSIDQLEDGRKVALAEPKKKPGEGTQGDEPVDETVAADDPPKSDNGADSKSTKEGEKVANGTKP